MTQNPPPLSHLHRIIQREPQALAKHAIALLEQRIHQEFGLTMHMGAELEFSLLPREGYPHANAISLKDGAVKNKDLQYYYPNNFGYIAAKYRPPTRGGEYTTTRDGNRVDGVIEHVTDPLFPDSPVVSFSYNEVAHNMLETVISHRARHDQLPPDGSRALCFARSIEALRHTVETANTPGRRYAKDPEHNAALRELSQQWKPVFDGTLETDAMRMRHHGLHVNLSFTNDDGTSLPEDFYRKSNRLRDGILPIMHEGAYLLTPDISAVNRLWGRQSTVKNNSLKTGKASHPLNYLEVSLPSANSDPYYTVMLTLAGVYACLQTGKFDPAKQRFTALGKLTDRTGYNVAYPPDNSAQTRYAERFFSGERRLFQLLNDLEPGLGERFETAVRAHPPQDSPQQTGAVRS